MKMKPIASWWPLYEALDDALRQQLEQTLFNAVGRGLRNTLYATLRFKFSCIPHQGSK